MEGWNMENNAKAESNSTVETQALQKERRLLADAGQKGRLATLAAYAKLSGPGWLQSGITLGGVSFSSSLYLGVLVGFAFMWLQPLAMILGIIMLGAIAYVTLSIRERPLKAIHDHVSPVLAWSWLLASMAANLVWSMPQFVLGTRAIQQNLLPKLLGPDAVPDPWGKVICVSLLLAVCITMTMFYGAGGRGVKIFEIIIKLIVSMIVLSFCGVVIKLSIEGQLPWGQIFRGLIPRLRMLSEPADTVKLYIQAVAPQFQQFWSNHIVAQQRDVMIAATAAAVGINMTFLLPYSMLRRGWDKHFRGLAIFDLSTGLFIPFILATGFVVIVSASQFHVTPAPGFLGEVDKQGKLVAPPKNLVGPYKALLTKRLQSEIGPDKVTAFSPEQLQARTSALPYADRKMAAMLVKRDNLNLAEALTPLTGSFLAQAVFGLGVMGMAIGAASVLMTINGLCLCEMLNRPAKGWTHRIGALIVSVGALAAIFWNKPAPWLAMPTSVFCIILLPIAYFAFLLLMNQKTMLGDNMPQGPRRVLWNVLMIAATAAAMFVSIWSLWSRLKWFGIAIMLAFVALVILVHFVRRAKKSL